VTTGAILWIGLSNPAFLLFGLLGPLMIVALWVAEEIRWRPQFRAVMNAFESELGAAAEAYRQAVESEASALEFRSPSGRAVCDATAVSLVLEALAAASELAWKATAEAVHFCGAAGLLDSSPVQRFCFQARRESNRHGSASALREVAGGLLVANDLPAKAVDLRDPGIREELSG